MAGDFLLQLGLYSCAKAGIHFCLLDPTPPHPPWGKGEENPKILQLSWSLVCVHLLLDGDIKLLTYLKKTQGIFNIDSAVHLLDNS